MPINVYTGLMRSGKSYEVVSEVIVPAVASGRRVVTNVDGISNDLVREYVISKNPDLDAADVGSVVHVTNQDVFKEDFFPFYDDKKDAHTNTIVQPGDLVAIDEAWRFWGTENKIHKNHKSFFLEHGHFTNEKTGVACDLVLMIQDMGTLHRFVKNVVAFNARTHKKVSLGFNNTYSIVLYEGHKQTKATIVSSQVRQYRKEIFPLYSSFKGGAKGKMVNVDKRQNKLADKKLWFVVLLCLLGGSYSFYNVWRFFRPAQSATVSKDDKTPAAASKPAAGTNSAPNAFAPSVPAFSESWRIVGRYTAKGEAWVVIANASGSLRVVSPSAVSNSGFASVGEIDGNRVTVFSGAAPARNPVSQAVSPAESKK